MTKPGDNRLPMLASKINAAHAAVEAAHKQGVEHAIEAGKLLLEAKAAVKHGQWGPWLAEHCTISDRSARLYMQVARNEEKLRGKSATVADLTLRGALDALDDSPEAQQRAREEEAADKLAEWVVERFPLEQVREFQRLLALGPDMQKVAKRYDELMAQKFGWTVAAWNAASPEARDEFRQRISAEAARQGVERVAVEF